MRNTSHRRLTVVGSTAALVAVGLFALFGRSQQRETTSTWFAPASLSSESEEAMRLVALRYPQGQHDEKQLTNESRLRVVRTAQGYEPDPAALAIVEADARERLSKPGWHPIAPEKYVRPVFPERFADAVQVSSQGHSVAARPVGARADCSASITSDGSLVYANAFPGCDVTYRASALRTEEYIVIREARGKASWSWDIEVPGGFKARLSPTNTIEFVDSRGVPRLRINAPEGKDADGKPLRVGERLALALDHSRLTLAVDMDGLTRPVVIDPSWSTTAVLAAKRAFHTATGLANGKVLVAGGANDTGYPGSELYDPNTCTWTGTGSMAYSHAEHSATLLANGKVLLVGGSPALPVCEIYDPDKGTWSPTGWLNQGRREHTATLLGDGRVLVTGGNEGNFGYQSECEIYDPSTGLWTVTAPMNVARREHTAVLIPSSGKVLAAGGYGGAYFTVCELYDPSTDSWGYAGFMNTPRGWNTITTLLDNRVLVTGGYGPGATSACELYSPATDTWNALDPMAEARASHTATLLGNGKVLIEGSYPGTSSCELFDPATGGWFAASSMATPRGLHTATLLGNGSVLVAGGFNAAYLSSCEVYDPKPQATPQSVGVNEDACVGIALQGTSIDVPSYAVTKAPAHGSVSGTAANVTYTPDADYFGTDSFTFSLSDFFGTSATATVTVNVSAVNDRPSFVKGLDKTVFEDCGVQTVSGWATGFDPGPPNESNQTVLAYLLSNTNTALFSAQPAINTAGTLTYTPAPNAWGTATVTVRVQDNGGTANSGVDTSDPQTFTITVTQVNDAPTLNAIADPAAILEDAGQQTVNLSGIGVGPNDPPQTLTVTATSSNPGLIPNPTVNYTSPNATGSLTYTPVPNAFGTATITVTVTDDGGTANGGVNTFSRTFNVAVTSVNDRPTFTAGANQGCNEDAGPQSVSNWATGFDPGQPNESNQTVLAYLLSNTNTALFSAQPAISTGGTLTYTPAANAWGTATVTVRVRDNGGTANGGVDTSDPQTFTITVTQVNDPPTLNPIADPARILEDAGQQTINLSGISSGPNDPPQTLTITATSSDTSIVPNPAVNYTSPNATGSLTYTPVPNAFGTSTITVTVTDGGGTADGGVNTFSHTFNVEVTRVNLVILGFPASVTAGTWVIVTVTAKDGYGNTATGYTGKIHFTSSDAAAVLPGDHKFVPEDNGAQSFIAALKTVGTQSITATDEIADTITGSQTEIAVKPADPRTLLVAGYPSPATSGTAGDVTVTAKDAYGNTVTGYTGSVHFTSTDGRAVLPADYPFVADDKGAHSFSVTLKTPGTHSITATDKATGSINGTQWGISVSARAITVTAVTDSKTYDGTTNSAGVPTITSGSLASGDSASWTQTFDTKDVGTGKTLTPAATVNDGNGGNNYSVTFVNDTSGVIIARAITVTADAKSKVYGAANPALTYTYTGLVNGDASATFTGALATAATTGSAVGTYPITQDTLAATGNYTIGTFNGANLTVTPAPLTITADDLSKDYGAALPTLTASYSGLVNGDTPASLTTPPTLSTTATASSGAGTYDITASGAVDANYTISYMAGTLTVNQAALTVTADAKSKVYGTANPALTYTYTGLVNGDTAATFTGALATNATASSGVGTYPITQDTLAATGNYTIGTFNGANLTVTAASLTVSPDDGAKVYGEVFSPFAGTVSGIQNSDNITASYASDGAAASATVGSYDITATLNDPDSKLSNYTVALNKGTLVVGKAAPAITWSNPADIAYGTALGATQLNATASVPGTFSYTPASGTVLNAGPSQALSVSFTPTDGANYNSANKTVSLTVLKAPLTITADGKTKVYGDALPALTVTYAGLVNGDTSATFTGALATTATTSSGVGTYPITQNTLAATGNYSIGTFKGASLTVTPAALTVTVDGKSKLYGTANPALTWTYTGLVNGDTSVIFTGALATTATIASGVGTYPITQGTLAGWGNYTIGTFNGANLTVINAALIVSADAQSKVYGAANPALTYTYTGLVNGDISATFTGALATSATAGSGVGTYPITLGTLAATDNYHIGMFIEANLVISQASATVTLGNLTQTYDGNPKSASASTEPAGLAVTFTYNGSITAPTNVGSYLVVGAINSANYQGTVSGILMINPAGTVAAPAFSPAAGTYVGAQSVALSCATSGATIYYTTDGSVPSTSAALYSVPINVSAAITVKAYAVQTGWVDSAAASATYTIYLQNSGGSSAPTPNVNVTATNPVGGVSVTVTYTDGGVVQLQVSLNGGALPAGYTATTTFYDASGNVLETVQGPQPIYLFTEPGMYLAVVKVTDAQGTPVGETEIALPISAAETGAAEGMTPPSSLAISAVSLTGKLLFNPKKLDSMSFKGTIELPAGLDLSKAQTLSVSLGNVVDQAFLDTKGRAKAGVRNLLKNVYVKYPRLPKVNKKATTITTAGLKATVSFTLSAPQLDLLGFDCTGVSKAGGIAGKSVQRIVGAALLLGGTAYRVDIPVDWKLSKKGDNGQVKSRK